MYDYTPLKIAEQKVKVRLRDRYNDKRNQYLDLCRQYGLPPKDLSLLLMMETEICTKDRIKIIRLIISLMDLEKLLGPGVLDDFLFAEDETQYYNSLIFQNELH